MHGHTNTKVQLYNRHSVKLLTDIMQHLKFWNSSLWRWHFIGSKVALTTDKAAKVWPFQDSYTLCIIVNPTLLFDCLVFRQSGECWVKIYNLFVPAYSLILMTSGIYKSQVPSHPGNRFCRVVPRILMWLLYFFFNYILSKSKMTSMMIYCQNPSL